MRVDAIHIRQADAAKMQSLGSVVAVAGQGLVGDRYFFAEGAKPGQALTLVEGDVVAEVGLVPGETRRQLTVTGKGLNDLVGKRFRVGAIECYGVELCEPCLHLQELTRAGIINDLVHRGGLNADILVGGTISIGDEIVEL
jgi:hypothetical protein